MYGVPEVSVVAPVGVEASWVFAVEYPARPVDTVKTFAYSVEKRGVVEADFEVFRRVVAETLADARGWVRAGVRFEEVGSGGMFQMILQEPAIFDTYAGCDATLSCRVGSAVMVNDLRWRAGTEYWDTTGLGIRDYRRLIVNHEVGHWLGHRHVEVPCSSTTVTAPLMLESSLRASCAPGIWPLWSELWHNR